MAHGEVLEDKRPMTTTEEREEPQETPPCAAEISCYR